MKTEVEKLKKDKIDLRKCMEELKAREVEKDKLIALMGDRISELEVKIGNCFDRESRSEKDSMGDTEISQQNMGSLAGSG